jgi:hypothetical protein
VVRLSLLVASVLDRVVEVLETYKAMRCTRVIGVTGEFAAVSQTPPQLQFQGPETSQIAKCCQNGVTNVEQNPVMAGKTVSQVRQPPVAREMVV